MNRCGRGLPRMGFRGALNPPWEAKVKFGIERSGLGDGRVAMPSAHLQCLEPIAT